MKALKLFPEEFLQRSFSRSLPGLNLSCQQYLPIRPYLKTFTLDFSSINVYRCILIHCRPEYKVPRIDAEMEGKRNMNT